jgi:hypothetical protein
MYNDSSVIKSKITPINFQNAQHIYLALGPFCTSAIAIVMLSSIPGLTTQRVTLIRSESKWNFPVYT